MWRKFKRHRLAIVGSLVLLLFYVLVAFAEVIAPVNPGRRLSKFPLAPRQRIHFIDAEGRFHLRPFVYGLEQDRDPVTLRRRYRELTGERYPIRFFVHGDRYRLWSWIEADLHLFGIGAGGVPFFLFGSDDQGRDLLSRIVYAARISLTLGLVGVALSFVMGISIGSISGYAGDVPDVIIPTPDRDSALLSLIAAVDGVERRTAVGLAGGAHLLLHFHHSVADRLDRHRAAGTGQVSVAA